MHLNYLTPRSTIKGMEGKEEQHYLETVILAHFPSSDSSSPFTCFSDSDFHQHARLNTNVNTLIIELMGPQQQQRKKNAKSYTDVKNYVQRHHCTVALLHIK